MTWPASQQTLEDGFNLANRTAVTIRGHVQRLRDNSAAGPVNRLRDWIFNNFPTNSGAWLFQSVDNQGVRVDLTFTTAQLGGFRTQADAFLATIT